VNGRELGCTPLHAAASSDNLATVKYLIEEKGADPVPKAVDGTTPLHLACVHGHCDVITYLIQHTSADPFGGQPISPFETASYFGNGAAMRAITEAVASHGKSGNAFPRKADRSRGPEDMGSYIFRAMVLVVSSSTEHCSEEEQDGRRAEALSVFIDLLPSQHMIRNLRTRYTGVVSMEKSNRGVAGDTLLHVAARLGRGRCVEVLLDAGADVSLRNEKGETAVDCAMPFLGNPLNKAGMIAVGTLIREWEQRRREADRSMLALVSTTSKEQSGGGETARAPAGTASKKKKLSKKKNKRKRAKQQQQQQQKQTHSKVEEEESRDIDAAVQEKSEQSVQHDSKQHSGSEDENSDNDSSTGGDGSSISRSTPGERELGPLEGMKASSVVEETRPLVQPNDSSDWVMAEGGRVRFDESKKHPHSSHPLANLKDLERALLDSLQNNPSTSNKDADRRKDFDNSNEESTPKSDHVLEQGGHGTIQPSPPDAVPSDWGNNGLLSPLPYTQNDGESSNGGGLFSASLMGDASSSHDSIYPPVLSRESGLNLDHVMQQVAWQGNWEPAWQQQPSQDEKLSVPESTAGLPRSFGTYSSLQEPIALEEQHVAKKKSAEELFAEMEPEAQTLGLDARHLVGAGLHELSVSQLDMVRELLLKRLNNIVEASIVVAREQGKAISKEERRRTQNFASFSQFFHAAGPH